MFTICNRTETIHLPPVELHDIHSTITSSFIITTKWLIINKFNYGPFQAVLSLAIFNRLWASQTPNHGIILSPCCSTQTLNYCSFFLCPSIAATIFPYISFLSKPLWWLLALAFCLSYSYDIALSGLNFHGLYHNSTSRNFM